MPALHWCKSCLSPSSACFWLNWELTCAIFDVCFTCWNAVQHQAFNRKNIGTSVCYRAHNRIELLLCLLFNRAVGQTSHSACFILLFFLSEEMGHIPGTRLNHYVAEFRNEEDVFLHLHHECNLILWKLLHCQSNFLGCSQQKTFVIIFLKSNAVHHSLKVCEK